MEHDLKRTARHVGITATASMRDGKLSVHVRGDVSQGTLDHWLRTFQKVFETVDALNEDQVRIGFDQTVVNLMRKGDFYVGIASEKGHSITKSIQRMVRKLMGNLVKGVVPRPGAFAVPTGPQRPQRPPLPPYAPESTPTPVAPSDAPSTPSVAFPGDKLKDPSRPW